MSFTHLVRIPWRPLAGVVGKMKAWMVKLDTDMRASCGTIT